ncbi:MAG: FIST C-terminal domain-containing protein [Treponema sp.]|nr:FIST C-terminal domain-containing protein [Treponema sp.]
MEQEVVTTKKQDPADAAKDLASQLKNPLDSYKAVIFMAAIKYDFDALSVAIKNLFPKSEVIGASTAGEINQNGFLNDSVVLTTLSDASTKVSGVLVENGSLYPIQSKTAIESALSRAGITTGDQNSHKNAFAITFINGVYNAEETVLTTFYSIIKNDKFQLAGGTAGFTGNTPKTFVSYNGKTTQDGAVMLFVKTQCKFDIRQEDIFNPTGKQVFVTEADPVNRIVSKFNGRAAKSVYAEMLGVSESQAEGMTFENPFGKHLNGSIHITALAGFTPDRKISLFARVVPNSTLEVMKIGDPLKKADETCSGIKASIPSPRFTLMMTCITRTMAFDRMHIADKIIDKYRATFPTFCGFSCYGEQIGRMHCNQTLVTVVVGN